MADEMAHMRVTSPTGYDHYWTPAGAVTSYKYGGEYTVKRAVLEAALKAGKGEDMDAIVVHSLADLDQLPIAPKPKRVRIQDAPQLASELDASDGA